MLLYGRQTLAGPEAVSTAPEQQITAGKAAADPQAVGQALFRDHPLYFLNEMRNLQACGQLLRLADGLGVISIGEKSNRFERIVEYGPKDLQLGATSRLAVDFLGTTPSG